MSNTMKDAMKKAGVNAKGGNTPAKKTKSSKRPTNISNLMHGTVKWFNYSKGFGFITGDDGKEYYVNHKHIVVGRTYLGFDAGDKVNFRVQADANTGKVNTVNVSLEIEDQTEAVTVDDNNDEQSETEN